MSPVDMLIELCRLLVKINLQSNANKWVLAVLIRSAVLQLLLRLLNNSSGISTIVTQVVNGRRLDAWQNHTCRVTRVT